MCERLLPLLLLLQGVSTLLPYVHNHLVSVEQQDLVVLLKEANPLNISLSPLAQDGLQALGKLRILKSILLASHLCHTKHCNSGINSQSVEQSSNCYCSGDYLIISDQLKLEILI